VAEILDTISLHPHFGRFSEGIVALSDIVYFAAVAAVAAAASRLALELRRVGG
jgi:hypothetical protein